MASDRCPECNTALPGDALFCPGCGQPVADWVAPRPPDRPGAGAPAAPAARPAPAWTEYLDMAWDFFASSRVATVLIFILAVASIIGSLVEQEGLYQDWRPPEQYYPYRYGPTLGNLFLRLGFTHAYTSTWYVSLLYLVVVSLVICSLQRLVPLHRALQRPAIEKHAGFVRRQMATAELPRTGPDPLAPVAERLRRQGFRVWRKGQGLHADRGRIGRYGPYIIHVGLIVCALAAAAKALPGWDVTQSLWVPDGQTVAIPGTGLAIRNERFSVETHPDGSVKAYQTNAVLLHNGTEVRRHNILVNHPLVYGQWEVYQASYRAEPGTAYLDVMVAGDSRDQDVKIGQIAFDLKNPAPSYELPGGLRARVQEYYHDIGVDEQTGRFVNKSREILAPAALLTFEDPRGRLIGRQALGISVIPGAPAMEPVGEGPIYLQQSQVKMRWYTGLVVRKDLSVPYMFTGLGIVLLGMWVTFFLFHRQVWALDSGDAVLLGARTNKNRYGLTQEVRKLAEALGGRLTGGLGAGTAPAADAPQGG